MALPPGSKLVFSTGRALVGRDKQMYPAMLSTCMFKPRLSKYLAFYDDVSIVCDGSARRTRSRG